MKCFRRRPTESIIQLLYSFQLAIPLILNVLSTVMLCAVNGIDQQTRKKQVANAKNVGSTRRLIFYISNGNKTK